MISAWSALFLLCSLTAWATFGISLRPSRPYRRLGFSFGINAFAFAVRTDLDDDFETFWCFSGMTGQGDLAKTNLLQTIGRQGCGATAEICIVRAGAFPSFRSGGPA